MKGEARRCDQSYVQFVAAEIGSMIFKPCFFSSRAGAAVYAIVIASLFATAIAGAVTWDGNLDWPGKKLSTCIPIALIILYLRYVSSSACPTVVTASVHVLNLASQPLVALALHMH